MADFDPSLHQEFPLLVHCRLLCIPTPPFHLPRATFICEPCYSDSNCSVGHLHRILPGLCQRLSIQSMQYELSQAIPGHIYRILYIIRPFFQPEATWRFHRYLHAAHCAGYVGLSGGVIYSRANFFDVIVKKHQLLTRSEFERINEIDPSLSNRGAIYRELLAWCSEEVAYFFLNLTNSKIPNQLCTAVLAEINNFESRMAGLYEFSDQPIPFIFLHLVNFCCCVWLPLFAYASATSFTPFKHTVSDEILSAINVLMMILFIAGIRLLGGVLLDPFGTDLGDFRVLSYVQSAIDASRRIILAKKGPMTTLCDELDLDSLRPDLGGAWSTTPMPTRSREGFEETEKEFSGVWRKTPQSYRPSSSAVDVNLCLILDPSNTASHNPV